MEFLQVFDEKKNKLEEKVSRDEKYNLPSDRRFMIVLIFIENSKGEFLLQKTSKSRHSCIATTGGHVTYGDSALETVVKELAYSPHSHLPKLPCTVLLPTGPSPYLLFVNQKGALSPPPLVPRKLKPYRTSSPRRST